MSRWRVGGKGPLAIGKVPPTPGLVDEFFNDPTGTGENWQGHLDLHALELATQAENGVPENQRLRGDTENCVRYWDSGDYLSVVPVGENEMLVTYDVQNFVEHPGDAPVAGVRMVHVRLEN